MGKHTDEQTISHSNSRDAETDALVTLRISLAGGRVNVVRTAPISRRHAADHVVAPRPVRLV